MNKFKGEIEMAVNPMQRKSRNAFLLGMFLMLLIGAGVAGFLIYQMSQLKDELAIKQAKTGYMLTTDVQSGTTLDSSMVKQVKMEYVPSDALSSADISGNELITKTALKKGVVLSTDMVTQVEEEVRKDTRIQEYNMITLPSKLENGNYIDIRLLLPSGQDFVVVSKKKVIECDTITIWLRMTEDEIIMMNNAIVEAYIMNGADLYATKYDEAGLQEPATITYAMSQLVDATFRQNPNILQDAKAAYNQRNATAAENRSAIERQLSAYNDDKKGNVESGVEKRRETQMEERLKYISDLDATY